MTVYTAGDTTTLASDLKIAAAGDTIQLTAGTYGPVTITGLNFGAGVTITSADPGNPATITQLALKNVTGLTFSGLNFSIAGFPVGGSGSNATWPFRVTGSTGITFDKIAMSGDPNGTLANTVCGLLVETSQQVSVTNSTFDHIHTALQFLNSDGVAVSGNSFQYIYDDGADFAATSDVTVSKNTFTSFHWDATDTQHPDCIQFYSLSGQTVIPTNITITDNNYTRGDGAPVHGIFMHDENGANPFTNVVISGNTLTGAQANGIVLIGGVNATIENNTVTSYADQKSWIQVETVNGGSVSGNAAAQYVYSALGGVNTSGNSTNALQPLPAADKLAPVSITVSGDGVDANGLGDLNAGKTVTITVTANERLWVTKPDSTTYLVLNDGGHATYVGGQGTRTLTFSYTVAATDTTVKSLAVTGVNGTITDATIDPSNPAKGLLDSADHELLAPDLTAPGLAAGLQIDTTAPTVTAASATPTPPGGAAVIALDISGAVNASGSTLSLSDGGTAVFDAANSTSSHLVYDYTVPTATPRSARSP